MPRPSRRRRACAQDVIKAEQRTSLQKLTAPVDGVVQQLAVHTIGGVVTPAQQLMVIVPADSRLEIEAMISNRDIGFVEAGAGGGDQDRHLQLHALRPVARHGAQRLARRHLSATEPQDQAADKPQAAEAGSSEPKGQELVYSARVSLDRTRMQVEDKTVNLSPGMAVTVEIKTGSRSILSYLLSPLVRYKHDSLRER